MQKNSLLILFTLSVLFARAQQPGQYFNREFLSEREKLMNDKKSDAHSGIQPLAEKLETNLFSTPDSSYKFENGKPSLCLGTLVNVAGGYQVEDKSKALYHGFAGLDLRLNNVKHWSLNVGYAISGGSPPQYLSNMGDREQVWAGNGFAIRDQKDLYHAHYTYGHVSYSNGKHFHFEVGKNKHFWGDGYRSLIVSDNANTFPYARITTKVWKLKYTNLWMQLRDLSYTNQLKKARIKYAAMHALSFNAGKRFNLSLYELVVWQDRDTMSRRSLDINYLNPIIFYRPVEYSVGSPDNVILALSMKYRPTPRLQIYGQFLLDEFNLAQLKTRKKWWANKYGGQLGFKTFDLMTPGFSWQSEANITRPFTYTHGSPIQSWTHLNQAMAHPLGCNFIEWVNLFRYDIKDWVITEEFIWAAYGRDRDIDGDGIPDNLGGNILRSYRNPYEQYGHEMLQGLKSTFYFQSLSISKKLGESKAFELFFNHTYRMEKNEFAISTDHFFQLGIRTSGLLQPVQDY
ncbi:MAG: hypothetical protein IPP69_00165 [Flavobacteriales bacterium]|nr:hypothetical protein [Flavobacteriales bacterium]